MRVGPFATALTFVLGTALTVAAAPKSGELELSTTIDQIPVASPLPDIESIGITEPPPAPRLLKIASTEIFYPYQSSFSPRVGTGTHTQRPSNEPYIYYVGFNYMIDSPNNRHYEVGIDLVSEAHGFLTLGYKWVFDHNSAFRPYFKVGPSVVLHPNEQMGTFLKFSNYQARIAGGIEKLMIVPMSLRLDVEAAIGSGPLYTVIACGYSWAW